MITLNECLKLEYLESMFLIFFRLGIVWPRLGIVEPGWPQHHYIQKTCFNGKTKQNKTNWNVV